MARDIDQAVREACLWLPEAEEFLSHGSPNFRVRGKTFATYVVNHHGDGRVALWLTALPGSQELHVREPSRAFLRSAVCRTARLAGRESRIAASIGTGSPRWCARAMRKSRPTQLRARIGKTPKLKAAGQSTRAQPNRSLQITACASPCWRSCARSVCAIRSRAKAVNSAIRVWLAGKKTFAIARYRRGAIDIVLLGGRGSAGMLIADPRYQIPAVFRPQRLDRARCHARVRLGRGDEPGAAQLSSFRPQAHAARCSHD